MANQIIIYKAQYKNKIYIGKTINLSKRKCAHHNNAFNIKCREYNILFYRNIRKYDWNSFKWEIIEKFNNEDIAINAEKDWIKFYRLFPHIECLNLTNGGEGITGYRFTEKQRQKLSNLRKGFPSPNKGKRGCCVHSEEWKRKRSKAQKGFKHSNETKKKLSKLRMGKSPANKGKSMTDEQKLKLSNARKKYLQKLKRI